MKIWKLLHALSSTRVKGGLRSGVIAGVMAMLSLTSVNATPIGEETTEERSSLTELLSESERPSRLSQMLPQEIVQSIEV